jgi:serine/threonine protein phosphatase 1
MGQRRICIGDVHGHYDTLMALLDFVAPDADDQVYFLGDLIDRGPKSAEIIEFIRKSPFQSLMGNHEMMMLEAIAVDGSVHEDTFVAWYHSGGANTLQSYNHRIPYEHLQWLRERPTHLDLGDIWLVHAGISPHLPLAQQGADQFCWVRGEFHSISQPYFTDKLVIVGHTITFTFPGVQPGQVVKGAGWLDIDTGVYHTKSGWLTAFDIDRQEVYQVNSHTEEKRHLPLEAIAVTPFL